MSYTVKCRCGRKVFKIEPGFLGTLWYCRFGQWHNKPANDRRLKPSTQHFVSALTTPAGFDERFAQQIIDSTTAVVKL